MSNYYSDKADLLADLFGRTDVTVEDGAISVGPQRYPVIDDVIILLPDHLRPAHLRGELPAGTAESPLFAADIQATFGAEWKTYPRILPEHKKEFDDYFDVVDLETLRGKRVIDLGCGIGRWSYHLQPFARQLVLVDFSEAIFVARENLRENRNAVFFMGDLTALPFRNDCADFLFCLGVLHHLESNALGEVRALSRFAPSLLIYLYSALDARPLHYRLLLPAVNAVRLVLARVRGTAARQVLTELLMWTVYMPFIGLGWLLSPLGLQRRVPLFDFYHDKSLKRIRQDVYDRFFTRIEQRFSRREIETLSDTFRVVRVSERLPMWHFLCQR